MWRNSTRVVSSEAVEKLILARGDSSRVRESFSFFSSLAFRREFSLGHEPQLNVKESRVEFEVRRKLF